MPGEWQIQELKVGDVTEATFWDDVNSAAAAVWSVLSRALREAGSPTAS